MFSSLSKGFGHWESGQVDLYNTDYKDHRLSSTLPTLEGTEVHRHGITVSGRSTAMSMAPHRPKSREYSDGHVSLPKTYSTRKGALQIFTAPDLEDEEDETQKSYTAAQKPRYYQLQRTGGKELIDLSLKLGTIDRLTKSVLQYGDEEYDHEKTSVSDEKNKLFMKFLRSLEDNQDVDTSAQPGGDLTSYLRDLRSRASSRYYSEGSMYIPKSRESQELQAILRGLDNNWPLSFPPDNSSERRSTISEQFTRPVSRVSSRGTSPVPPSTPRSTYQVLSTRKLAASIKSASYLGRPSSAISVDDDEERSLPEFDMSSTSPQPVTHATVTKKRWSPTESTDDGGEGRSYRGQSMAGSSIAEEDIDIDDDRKRTRRRDYSSGLLFQGRSKLRGDGRGVAKVKGKGEGRVHGDRVVADLTQSKKADVNVEAQSIAEETEEDDTPEVWKVKGDSKPEATVTEVTAESRHSQPSSLASTKSQHTASVIDIQDASTATAQAEDLHTDSSAGRGTGDVADVPESDLVETNEDTGVEAAGMASEPTEEDAVVDEIPVETYSEDIVSGVADAGGGVEAELDLAVDEPREEVWTDEEDLVMEENFEKEALEEGGRGEEIVEELVEETESGFYQDETTDQVDPDEVDLVRAVQTPVELEDEGPSPVSIETEAEVNLSEDPAQDDNAVYNANAEAVIDEIDSTDKHTDLAQEEEELEVETEFDVHVEEGTGQSTDVDTELDEVTKTEIELDEVTKTEIELGGDTKTEIELDGVTKTEIELGGVTQTEIELGGVTKTEIELGGVTQTEIELGGVTKTEIELGGVTQTEIELGGDTKTEIELGGVTKTEIELNGVTKTEIEPDGVTEAEVEETRSPSAGCRGGGEVEGEGDSPEVEAGESKVVMVEETTKVIEDYEDEIDKGSSRYTGRKADTISDLDYEDQARRSMYSDSEPGATGVQQGGGTGLESQTGVSPVDSSSSTGKQQATPAHSPPQSDSGQLKSRSSTADSSGGQDTGGSAAEPGLVVGETIEATVPPAVSGVSPSEDVGVRQERKLENEDMLAQQAIEKPSAALSSEIQSKQSAPVVEEKQQPQPNPQSQVPETSTPVAQTEPDPSSGAARSQPRPNQRPMKTRKTSVDASRVRRPAARVAGKRPDQTDSSQTVDTPATDEATPTEPAVTHSAVSPVDTPVSKPDSKTGAGEGPDAPTGATVDEEDLEETPLVAVSGEEVEGAELEALKARARSMAGKSAVKSKKRSKTSSIKSGPKSRTDDISTERTASPGSTLKLDSDKFVVPDHLTDALNRHPGMSYEALEKDLERRGFLKDGKVTDIIDSTLAGPTLEAVGEGLTEEEFELAKQILQTRLNEARDQIADPGRGKKKAVGKAGKGGKKGKKKEELSAEQTVELERNAILQKQKEEQERRDSEVKELQRKIAERKLLLRAQENAASEKSREIREDMERLEREAEEMQQAEEDARQQLAEVRKKQREERELRRRADLERKKQLALNRREQERKQQEEARQKELEMLERIADAEMRRRLREEEERKMYEEDRLAQERLEEELREQQREAEEEEERRREHERQAEEDALEQFREQQEAAERQTRRLREEKEKMEEAEKMRRDFMLSEQRRLEEQRALQLKAEEDKKEQDRLRLLEIRRLEEEAMLKMQEELEQRRADALQRRDHNLENRGHVDKLRYNQGITRAWTFSYFVHWSRDTYERPIGGVPDKRKRLRPRPAPPKPPTENPAAPAPPPADTNPST